MFSRDARVDAVLECAEWKCAEATSERGVPKHCDGKSLLARGVSRPAYDFRIGMLLAARGCDGKPLMGWFARDVVDAVLECAEWNCDEATSERGVPKHCDGKPLLGWDVSRRAYEVRMVMLLAALGWAMVSSLDRFRRGTRKASVR